MFIGDYVEKVQRQREDETKKYRKRKHQFHKCRVIQRITGLC